MDEQQQQNFDHYKNTFIQRKPRYGVQTKPGSKKWSTRHFALHDNEIEKHLITQEQHIACIGQWYPKFLVWDLDRVTPEKIDEVKYNLALTGSQFLLCSSLSPDSYHLITVPEYNSEPTTLYKLNRIVQPWAAANNIEAYPQQNKPFRSPFGKGQRIIDEMGALDETWEQQLHWFDKLDPFDLSTIANHQMPLAFRPEDNFENKIPKTLFDTSNAQDLFENGLQGFNTRDSSQFELVRYLWRANFTREATHATIWDWIKKKHNGFSEGYPKDPKRVYRHIGDQTKQYFNYMLRGRVYPDQIQTSHQGYICKSDLINIVELAQGSLPRIRFGFNLVKFMNPRQHRDDVTVSRSLLRKWSSNKTYLKHIQFLDSKGLLTRGNDYSRIEHASKSLKLTWDYQKESDGIFYEGRAIQDLEKAVATIFKPEEFRGLLRRYVEKNTAKITTRRIFRGGVQITPQ
jgi:hypothetical protein